MNIKRCLTEQPGSCLLAVSGSCCSLFSLVTLRINLILFFCPFFFNTPSLNCHPLQRYRSIKPLSLLFSFSFVFARIQKTQQQQQKNRTVNCFALVSFVLQYFTKSSISIRCVTSPEVHETQNWESQMDFNIAIAGLLPLMPAQLSEETTACLIIGGQAAPKLASLGQCN